MMGIKDRVYFNHDLDLVDSLVQVAVALSLCADAHPLEKMDLEDRLRIVQQMLAACMDSDSMDDERNVTKVLQCPEWRRKHEFVNPVVHKAQTLLRGPLAQCIKYKLYDLIGTTQVSVKQTPF